MQIAEIPLPDGWVEHTDYANRMVGVVAAYRREDWSHFIEVVEYQAHIEHTFKVEVRQANGDEPETFPVEDEPADTYGGAALKVTKFASEYS